MRDTDEVYAECVLSRRVMTDAEALADQAESDAYDDLLEFIQDELPPGDSQEYLMKIATIWQGKESTAEKYGLIGDVMQGIVDLNAKKKLRG